MLTEGASTTPSMLVRVPVTFDPTEDGRSFRLTADAAEFIIPKLDGHEWRRWSRRHATVNVEYLAIRESKDGESPSGGNTPKVAEYMRRVRADEEMMDSLVDLFLAYDRTGVLSRAWVEDNVTEEEILLLVHRILAAHA